MSRSNMSKKSKSRSEINKKYEKMRNWTTDEITLFAVVLSDDQFSFAEYLEKRTLKKSANEGVFNSILEEFRKRLKAHSQI